MKKYKKHKCLIGTTLLTGGVVVGVSFIFTSCGNEKVTSIIITNAKDISKEHEWVTDMNHSTPNLICTDNKNKTISPVYSCPNLPTWLRIDPNTGSIFGTPTVSADTQEWTITATYGKLLPDTVKVKIKVLSKETGIDLVDLESGDNLTGAKLTFDEDFDWSNTIPENSEINIVDGYGRATLDLMYYPTSSNHMVKIDDWMSQHIWFCQNDIWDTNANNYIIGSNTWDIIDNVKFWRDIEGEQLPCIPTYLRSLCHVSWNS